MADEKIVAKGKDLAIEQAKEPAKEQAKEGTDSKFVSFFKNLWPNICRPFKNMWHELRKVTWPTRQDLIKYSLIVLAFLVFMGIVIGLLDYGSSALVNAIHPIAATAAPIL